MHGLRSKPTVATAVVCAIRQRIVLITADGAANEQVALRLLHPQLSRASQVQMLLDVKFNSRDTGHISRSIAERSFRVDPVLQELCVILLFKKDFIAKLLRFFNHQSFANNFRRGQP